MQVYLSEHIAPSAYARLARHFEIVDNFDHPEQLAAMIIRRAVVPRTVIARAPNLKVIAMHGVSRDTIDTAAAAEYGVPVVMVSGDDKLCAEAQEWLGEVECAQVKWGIGRQSALCLSPARGQELVYEHARRAVERLKRGEAFVFPETHNPARVAITYKMMPDADAANVYGTRRLDGYTVETTWPSLSAMYGGVE